MRRLLDGNPPSGRTETGMIQHLGWSVFLFELMADVFNTKLKLHCFELIQAQSTRDAYASLRSQPGCHVSHTARTY